MPQLPGQVIGPDPRYALTDKLPAWVREALAKVGDFQDTLQQQPVVQVASSPLGQVMSGAIGEGAAPRINLATSQPMPTGMVMRNAFHGALDDAYAAHRFASPALRAPKAAAVDNIYNQLVAMGRAAPPEEMAKLRATVDGRIKAFGAVRGVNQEEVAPVQQRASSILAHLQKSGYQPDPKDAALLEDRIRAVQRFAPRPNAGTESGPVNRGLGELVMQVRNEVPKGKLRTALWQANGWAGNPAPVRAGMSEEDAALQRKALIQQLTDRPIPRKLDAQGLKPKIEAKLKEALARGTPTTRSQLADGLGVSQNGISAVLTELGMDEAPGLMRRAAPNKSQLSPEMIEKLRKRVQSGGMWSAIGADVGIDAETAQRWTKKYIYGRK